MSGTLLYKVKVDADPGLDEIVAQSLETAQEAKLPKWQRRNGAAHRPDAAVWQMIGRMTVLQGGAVWLIQHVRQLTQPGALQALTLQAIPRRTPRAACNNHQHVRRVLMAGLHPGIGWQPHADACRSCCRGRRRSDAPHRPSATYTSMYAVSSRLRCRPVLCGEMGSTMESLCRNQPPRASSTSAVKWPAGDATTALPTCEAQESYAKVSQHKAVC